MSVCVVLTSVNAAFGCCSHTARSSAEIVSQPNLNIYRPGSVTRPTCAQVILLTANHFPLPSFQNLILKRHALGVVLLEPCFRGVRICEHFEMIGIADLLAGVDVNQDGH